MIYSDKAMKQINKLDRFEAKKIKKWIESNLIGCENPYFQGKMLKGNLSNYWRYRVGNYRIISSIDESRILICILKIGHRKSVYNFET